MRGETAVAGDDVRATRGGRIVAAVSLLAVMLVGCGSRSTRPRSREDVFQDRLRVDTLFITEDGRRFTRPMNPDRVIVVEGGKLAWPAWQCDNPDCPGRGADGKPVLFPWPDPFKAAAADGSITDRQPLTREDEALFEKFIEQTCPECLKKRTIASENKARRQQYKNWCQPHVLPSAAKQLKALERELEAMLGREPGPPKS